MIGKFPCVPTKGVQVATSPAAFEGGEDALVIRFALNDDEWSDWFFLPISKADVVIGKIEAAVAKARQGRN